MWLVVQVQVCSVPRRWLGWNQPNRQIGLVHQAQCCVELDRETIAVGFDQWSACHVWIAKHRPEIELNAQTIAHKLFDMGVGSQRNINGSMR